MQGMLECVWRGSDLGVMGYPMAGHLVTRGGLDVTVYNRTAAKAEKWSETFKGPSRPTPAEAARDADFVFACVGNDDDLRQVTTGRRRLFPHHEAGRSLHRSHHGLRPRGA